MSRHRNVRAMDYEDEYDGYDDVYGRSADDDPSCISPTDAQQWMYKRAQNRQSLTSFIADDQHKDIPEEEEFHMPNLSADDEIRLQSVMEAIRNVVGLSMPEPQLVNAVLKNDYDFERALDAVLNANDDKEMVDAPSSKADLETGFTSSKILQTKIDVSSVASGSSAVATSTTPSSQPISITMAGDATRRVRKGFNAAVRSPVVSGRNSPEHEIVDDRLAAEQQQQQREQSNRDYRKMFNDERGNEKMYIHMVVIGHVDAGKSTLMGHTLYDLGAVQQRVMHKYEQESRKIGKQSFAYAWVLDETGEERERGITIDVAVTRFETAHKIVTLLDAPGHRDFIPNMISGATQADVALLVVDATRGEFETGFEQGGQTREHAVLVRSLGVNQLGVVVNKLDTVNWSKERFDEIVTKLKTFLRHTGFKESDVTYTPCSGLTGENLVHKPTSAELLSWYTGPTLVEVIDSFKDPERSMGKPFRMTIADNFKSTGQGLCVSGRIETGVLCANDKILVCPLREQATIRAVYIDDVPRASAFAGDHVTVTFAGGIDVANIAVGSVLCDIDSPIPMTTRVQARIVVFSLRVPIISGTPIMLHHQSLVQPATIVRLKEQLHKQTGEVVKKNPRCLTNNMCAIVELETSKPICIERYADVKELGRVMLRIAGVTVAAGLVTKVYKK